MDESTRLNVSNEAETAAREYFKYVMTHNLCNDSYDYEYIARDHAYDYVLDQHQDEIDLCVEVFMKVIAELHASYDKAPRRTA